MIQKHVLRFAAKIRQYAVHRCKTINNKPYYSPPQYIYVLGIVLFWLQTIHFFLSYARREGVPPTILWYLNVFHAQTYIHVALHLCSWEWSLLDCLKCFPDEVDLISPMLVNFDRWYSSPCWLSHNVCSWAEAGERLTTLVWRLRNLISHIPGR